MKRQFSLAQLTVMNCAPPDMTYLAARCGYDFVSFRFIPLHTPGEPEYLPTDTAMLRRTKAALAATGLKMLDLELARFASVAVSSSRRQSPWSSRLLGEGPISSRARLAPAPCEPSWLSANRANRTSRESATWPRATE